MFGNNSVVDVNKIRGCIGIGSGLGRDHTVWMSIQGQARTSYFLLCWLIALHRLTCDSSKVSASLPPMSVKSRQGTPSGVWGNASHWRRFWAGERSPLTSCSPFLYFWLLSTVLLLYLLVAFGCAFFSFVFPFVTSLASLSATAVKERKQASGAAKHQ